jgi:hypothetical protein
MAKFEAGNNPADHTVAEVNEFLRGDEVTGDEHDRVMQAEREGRNRIGIMSGSGQEEPAPIAPEAPVEDAAGPNEAATGQESPADQASTVDDPAASGDAGTTAEPYPDDAPASLGPEKPQSAAEEAAHAATLASLEAAELGQPVYDDNGNEVGRKYTPEEALQAATQRARAWKSQPSNTAQ